MDFISQFWPQLTVLSLLVLFLIKDLVGYQRDNIRVSSWMELLRYGIEFAVVISTGFLSWSFFKVLYVVDVSINILLVGVLVIFWRQFTLMQKTKEHKNTFVSKVRIYDFFTTILLYFAGFFDGLIAAL